jgi:hypothetical protein
MAIPTITLEGMTASELVRILTQQMLDNETMDATFTTVVGRITRTFAVELIDEVMNPSH